MAAALVIREIRPQYVVPLGVWQIREGVRAALKSKHVSLESMLPSITYACSHLSVSANEIVGRSWLVSYNQNQRKMTDFV